MEGKPMHYESGTSRGPGPSAGQAGGPLAEVALAASPAAARQQAEKHALAAAAPPADLLGRELVQRHDDALRQEWRPQTPTEDFLVRDLARHQAALERIERIELAVLMQGAQLAPQLLWDGAGEQDPSEAMLAAAGTSQAIQTISRYRRQHERAYWRTLEALRQARAMAASVGPVRSPHRSAFTSEEECQAYLAQRARRGGFCCRTCASGRGHWVATRGLWQCCDCRKQAGVRQGTVMDGSRLSLLVWFRAIELLIREPNATTTELTAATGVPRQGTIRKLAQRIRQAKNAVNASEQLAGLDQLFREPARESGPAAVSAPQEPFFLKRQSGTAAACGQPAASGDDACP